MVARRVLRALAFAALVSVAVSCGKRASPQAPSNEAGAAEVRARRGLAPGELDALIAEVSGARRLRVLRPVQIEQLQPANFAARVDGLLAEAAPTEAERRVDEGFLAGFNLVPSGDGAPPPGAAAVLREQIIGFYDREGDAIYVQASEPTSPEDAIMQRGVIAHEVHHALQAQHFGATRGDTSDWSDDRWLAHRALMEGDAMVAMAAYLGASHGAPINRSIRRITDVLVKVPLDKVAHQEERGDTLAAALPILKARVTFPYEQGMVFVADVYRAGGFQLVDRIYERPPTATMHVLHPETYLAGVQPAALRVPTPGGLEPVVDDTLGELQTAIVLETCHDRATAVRVAEGWRGDRYLLAIDRRAWVMGWSTLWADDREAAEFERALGDAKDCWREHAPGEGTHGIAAGAVVERQGRRVAVVRGMPPGRAQSWAREILAAPAQLEAPRPLGDYAIPARVDMGEPQPATLQGTLYRSDWIGIQGRVPDGMKGVANYEHVELRIDRPNTPIAGALVVNDRMVSPRYVELAFDDIRASVDEVLDYSRLKLVDSREGRNALGGTIERTWKATGTPIHIRAVMVPICAGTGSLVFIQAYGDRRAREVLDGWIGSFSWLRGANAPICDWLDPK